MDQEFFDTGIDLMLLFFVGLLLALPAVLDPVVEYGVSRALDVRVGTLPDLLTITKPIGRVVAII
jgi:hypothetical protein